MKIHKTRPEHFPPVDFTGLKYKPGKIEAYITDVTSYSEVFVSTNGWIEVLYDWDQGHLHYYHHVNGCIYNDLGPAHIDLASNVNYKDGMGFYLDEGTASMEEDWYWTKVYKIHKDDPVKAQFIMAQILGSK
jgi:hypothetical protein